MRPLLKENKVLSWEIKLFLGEKELGIDEDEDVHRLGLIHLVTLVRRRWRGVTK